MAVGILLLTHEGIGTAMKQVAERLLAPAPLRIEVFEVPFDGEPDGLLPLASAALRRADSGDGVLVLTDLYGASPANIGTRLSKLGSRVRRVSALNLPMLLRVLNYGELALDELPAIAVAGARNGVQADDA
jgi:PTS system ascorbate-specific IIA component